MATLIASAKLYQSTRCLLADKNISANLTASFSLGNQRQPNYQGDLIQPVIVNGVPTVFANVLPFTPVKFVCDLYCEPSSISLTPQRIIKQGGGNRVYSGEFVTAQQYVITTVGTTDWTTIGGAGTYAVGTVFTAIQPGTFDYSTGRAQLYSWHTVSLLRCVFPTYVRIDIEKLMDMGLGEGQDCVVQLEEGFLLEDKGVPKQASPFFEFADNVKDSPTPRNDNYVSFRTPKRFRSAFNSIVSMPATTVSRRRSMQSAFFGASTLSAIGIFNPGKFAALFAGVSTILTSPVKTARYLYDFYNVPGIVFTMITNNTRARLFNVNVNSDTSVSVNTTGSRVRKTPADLFLYVNVSSAGTRSASLVPTAISSAFTMNATAVKDVKTITTEAVTSSLTCSLTGLATAVCNITATSTFESNSDLVFVYYGQNFVGSPFVNAYYEEQYTSNATIFWGDGTSEIVGNTGPARSHTYPYVAEWTVRVRVPAGSVLKGFSIIDVNTQATEANHCIRKIKTFGQIGIVSLYELCLGGDFEAALVDELPDALPDTVRNLHGAFRSNQFWFAWNGPYGTIGTYGYRPGRNHDLIGRRIQNWDVSRVTNFQNCFANSIGVSTGDGTAAYSAAIRILYSEMDLRLWNTQSATNMIGMFNKTNIDQDLSGWCVPLIASTPSDFYAPLNGLPSRVNANFQPPVWGTCP